MTTLTATTPTTSSGPTPTVSPAAFDRPLTDDELAHVTTRVRSTDHEHGIVAALAVADIAAADRRAADHAHAPMAVPTIPLRQWRAIQAVIDREARRHAPGGESAVLADWVEFGPRVSGR